ncbi:MAG: type II secretion system F family protein [Gammaproteobacteria bacterium]|nr:type II secretion system F family protein [Gammaproteobacteria bacterium]
MNLYRYEVVRNNGERSEGERRSPSREVLLAQLQAEGFIPLQIREGSGLGRRPLRLLQRRAKRLPPATITALTRELATLLESGIPLERGLSILRDLAQEEEQQRLLGELLQGLQQGDHLSDVVEREPDYFPKIYINMVRAGERSGAMEQVLIQLAEYRERSQALRESVRSALIYPSILVTVAGLSVILLLMFVVPQFQQMFEDMGATLPLATRIVVAIGEGFRHYWWLLLALILGTTAAFAAALERPHIRLRWDGYLLRLPLLGDLLTKVETARFTRTLAVLASNGLPLLSSMQLAGDVMTNRVLTTAVKEAAERLKSGQRLAGSLEVAGVFPPLALQMIRVGEESGSLSKMLLRVADVYDQEVKNAINRALTLIEPVLIVGLGVVVAAIIASILMAILGANQLAF